MFLAKGINRVNVCLCFEGGIEIEPVDEDEFTCCMPEKDF